MQMHEDRYFFLSGLISLGLFFSLLLLVGYTLLAPTKIEKFAMTKSDFVSVSIDVATPQQSQPAEQPIQETQPTPPAPNKETREEEPSKPAATPDIGDLFSSVKPSKLPKKSEENAHKIEELNALEQKMMTTSQKSQISEKVSTMQLAKPSVKVLSQSGSTGPEVNEYHAKIQALIYNSFHPPTGTQGQAARVKISLDASGRLMGYRVVAYSGNGAFNTEVDWLKERLRNVRFPANPNGRDAAIEIILTAKD